MTQPKTVKFDACFDRDRQCFQGHGDGSAKLTFTLSADQMAAVLTAYAFLRDKLLEVKVTVKGDYAETKKGNLKKVYR